MRPSSGAAFAALAFALLAGCGERVPPENQPLPELTSRGGPEVVVLRVTRDGGFPRAYRWPTIDVPAWTGAERLPPIQRLLAFDDGSGSLTFVAEDARAGRVDLRTGRFTVTEAPLALADSHDGTTLVGFTEGGRLWRATPNAEWMGPATHADTAFALRNGHVVLVGHERDATRLIRVRPQSDVPYDTLEIPLTTGVVQTLGGDRLFARTAHGAVAVDTRTWTLARAPRLGDEAIAIAPTPSGDRAFILSHDGRTIHVWARFAERWVGEIELGRPATALRMDPMGRFLLARSELGDSASVISVPTLQFVRTLATDWRGDLPTFAADGSLLVLRDDDVHVMDPVTGARKRRVRGAARDIWMFVRWDGFRPRDSSLDLPATFETEIAVDSAADAEKIDSLLAAHAEIVERERLDSIARATARPRATRDTAAQSFTLSFASLLSESAARALAERIRVDGRPPRIVAGSRDGITIYRVVMGPYPTREAAEAAGQKSGVPFWVFAGLP